MTRFPAGDGLLLFKGHLGSATSPAPVGARAAPARRPSSAQERPRARARPPAPALGAGALGPEGLGLWGLRAWGP